MEMTTLGRTGLKVSRLGAGLAGIGLRLSRAEVDKAGRVLNTFLDNGINFLDAAECYGIAHEAIGRYVSHRRDEFVLATKVGHNPNGFYLLIGRPWSAKTIEITLDQILKTLGTDHVDILQLHSPNMLVLERGEAIEAIEKAKKAGKTRFIGYSGDNAEALWAVNSGRFDTLQGCRRGHCSIAGRKQGLSFDPCARRCQEAKMGLRVLFKQHYLDLFREILQQTSTQPIFLFDAKCVAANIQATHLHFYKRLRPMASRTALSGGFVHTGGKGVTGPA